MQEPKPTNVARLEAQERPCDVTHKGCEQVLTCAGTRPGGHRKGQARKCADQTFCHPAAEAGPGTGTPHTSLASLAQHPAACANRSPAETRKSDGTTQCWNDMQHVLLVHLPKPVVRLLSHHNCMNVLAQRLRILADNWDPSDV